MTDISFWQTLFAGVVLACVTVNAVALLTSGAGRPIVLTGLLFLLGVLLLGFEDIVEQTSFAPMRFHVSGIASVVAILGLWTFSSRLFDITLRPVGVAGLACSLSALYFAGHLVPTWHFTTMLAANCLIIAISLMTVILVFRSRSDDLDESRRRLRNPFIALIGCWTAIAAIIGSLAGLGKIPDTLSLVDEGGLAIVAICATGLFTQARKNLFPRRSRPSTLRRKKSENDLASEALMQSMTVDKMWEDEGLSLAGLSLRLRVSERNLRAIIHNDMGFRNFSSFVNSYRIAEAKRRLTLEIYNDQTIASIAYASGFGSLGPFNRAFKLDTGLTPTAFQSEMTPK